MNPSMTGEPIPVEKAEGSRVTGGTVNGTGTFVMRAERVGSETLLAQIVHMVSEAQRSRAPVQKLADRVAAYFVPAVVLIAILTFAIWAAFDPSQKWRMRFSMPSPSSSSLAHARWDWQHRWRSWSALAGSSRRHPYQERRIPRNSRESGYRRSRQNRNADRRQASRHIADSDGRINRSATANVAAALERASEHPLAAAVLAAAKEHAIEIGNVTDFRSFTGKGITGRQDETRTALGNRALFDELRVPLGPLADRAKSLESEGQTVMFVAANGQAIGAVGVSDPIKPTTAEAIDRLHRDGIRIVMLTGDSRATAESVARNLKIDSVEAQVLPSQKGEIVNRLKAEGHIVAMAGDGVNDAPALAAANVGIAMGTGTDVAIESAGITLLKGDLVGIARARTLSRATMRKSVKISSSHSPKRTWRSHCRRNPLSLLRSSSEPYPGQRRDDLQLRFGDHQRTPSASRRSLTIASRFRITRSRRCYNSAHDTHDRHLRTAGPAQSCAVSHSR